MTLRVLVVDDEPGAGSGLRSALGGAGCESVWLERGEEALRMLEHGPFDVILTELNLDGMDGFELCRRVEAVRPGLPVIVLTRAPSLLGAVEAFRAGAADFVSKAEPSEAVLCAITRVTGRASAKAPSSERRPGKLVHEPLCSMEEVERKHVTHVLAAVGGNKREAARILQLDRTTLYRKLKRYGISSQRRPASSISGEHRIGASTEDLEEILEVRDSAVR